MQKNSFVVGFLSGLSTDQRARRGRKPTCAEWLYSEELGLGLRIGDGDLNLFCRGTNDRLLTNLEIAEREAEARQRVEDGVERLRAELAKLKGGQH